MLKLASKLQHNQFGERRTEAEEALAWEGFHAPMFGDHLETVRQIFGEDHDHFRQFRRHHL